MLRHFFRFWSSQTFTSSASIKAQQKLLDTVFLINAKYTPSVNLCKLILYNIFHFLLGYIIFPSFPVKVFADLGANVTLPCRLLSKDLFSFGNTGIRIKWTKVADDESLNEDVLMSMGFLKKTYGSFENRVFLEGTDKEDATIIITDVGVEDTGRYRCEIINGMEDSMQEVFLEVQSGLIDGKSCL